MRGWLIGSLVGVAMLASGAAWADEAEVNEAAWLTDYAEAKAAARRAGKPMLVVFR